MQLNNKRAFIFVFFVLTDKPMRCGTAGQCTSENNALVVFLIKMRNKQRTFNQNFNRMRMSGWGYAGINTRIVFCCMINR